MNDKSRKNVKIVLVLLAVVLSVACFITACQPVIQTTEAASSAGESGQTAQTASVAFESPVLDTGTSVSSLKAPSVYKFNTVSSDGKITVEANAPVNLPKVDKVPTAKAAVGQFTQAQVSGMLKYIYGNTPFYAEPRYTQSKSQIQQQIDQLTAQKETNEVYKEDQTALDSIDEQIQMYEKELPNAPDVTPKPYISDGTMWPDPAYPERSEIFAFTGDVDTGKEMTTFSCINGDGTESKNLLTASTSGINYYNYQGGPKGTYTLYTMDKAVRITGDADIPADIKTKLNLTFTQAKARLDGLLDAAGVSDMQMAAAYIVDDHSWEDHLRPAKNYAIQLFYERTINGVPVMTMGDSVGWNLEKKTDRIWVHEQLQARINSDGIIWLSWRSPDSVDGPLTAGSTFIDFEQATAIFEENIIPFYQEQPQEAGAKSIDIKIDSVQLGLFRLKQQSEQGRVTGKFVPVWAFYGTTAMKIAGQQEPLYDGGSSITTQGPYIVFCVNALDGSVIDISKGY